MSVERYFDYPVAASRIDDAPELEIRSFAVGRAGSDGFEAVDSGDSECGKMQGSSLHVFQTIRFGDFSLG